MPVIMALFALDYGVKMGAYKLEKICDDFDIVTGACSNTITGQMKIIALTILESLPDNEARDMAISHLLQSAEFIKLSIMEAALKT